MKHLLKTLVISVCVYTSVFSQNPPSYVPSNGLKGWWSFTGNANDESGNFNDGTVNGADLVTDRFGNVDAAYSFDGLSTYIELQNPINGLEINNAISISIWAMITGTNTNLDCNAGCSQYLISRNTDVTPDHFSIRIDELTSSNKFSGQINDNFTADCGVQSPVSYPIPQTNWHHIVLTYDGVDVKLFVDGMLQGTSPYAGPMNPSGEHIFIGTHNDPLFPYFVNGFLDDIGIWDRALSACEVQQLYDTTVFSPDFLQDTLSVCGTEIDLVAPDGYTYLWNTSETNDTIALTQNGWYYCTLTDTNACSVTDSVYVNLLDAHIEQNDTTICEGETILLNLEPNTGETFNFEFKPQTDLLIDEQFLSFSGPSSFTIPNLDSGNYYIEASGTFCMGDCWIWGISYDAAYNFQSSTQPFEGAFSINEYCQQGTLGCTYPRPVPDQYNPNHVYYYPYVSVGGPLTIYGLADEGFWEDNLYGINFKVYQIIDSTTYLWSTGDTTASISVTPTQTTTYYCTVDNGVTSCTDSVVVTVSPTTYADLYDTVCNEYTAPSGLLYNTSGIYFDTIPNAAGCDSLITIYLTVNQNDTSFITETVCDMYTQDGQMFMSSGQYSYTIPTVNGCDSLINLDLTVLMSSNNTIVETACSPYIAPDGQSFTSSGLYTVVIPNSVGCDSNIMIDLTILSDSIYLPASDCYSYTAPDGNTYTETGIYTAVFMNQFGCDSIIYIDLTIQSNDTSIIETACESYTAPDGQIYTTSDIYTATLTNSFGCDSIITIDLTVLYGTPNTIVETVCETYTAPDGQEYTTSGIYTAILPSSNGCDSTITIDLTVNYNTSNSLVESACEMYIAPDGQMLMTSGIYTVTIPTFTGCDSVITIDLVINQPSSNTINETVCSSYTAPDGQIYSVNGTYTAIIPNAFGCDSLITINLTINTSTVELFQSACDTYTAPDGQVYTVSGTYTAIIPTVLGCDSIITINLLIFNPTSTTITEEACGSYTAPDGQIYTTSGVYTAVIPNFGGCDSTITIELIINESTQSTIDVTSCTQYLAPDGQIYVAPGTYTATIANAAGCDSIITINLQMNSTASTIADTQCIFYIAPDGQTYTTSGTYVAIIPNSIGCDSVIAINLVIVDTADCTDDADLDGVVDNLEILDGTNPYDSCSYLISSMTLAQLSGADCDMDGIMDTTEINNGTDPFDSCDPNNIGIQCQDGTFIPTGFSPNGIGDAENEKLMLLIGKNVASFTFDIYDRWGHLVFSTSDETNGWDGTYDGKPCNSGIYAYVMNVIYFDKLPEIKTGNITLIR